MDKKAVIDKRLTDITMRYVRAAERARLEWANRVYLYPKNEPVPSMECEHEPKDHFLNTMSPLPDGLIWIKVSMCKACYDEIVAAAEKQTQSYKESDGSEDNN